MTCSCQIPIRRVWAMPSAETFTIPPIAELLDRWLDGRAVIVDPFARNSKRGTITNDLNPETTANFHLSAQDFVGSLEVDSVEANAVLFDPPYSPRQISECYQSAGLKAGMEETQNGRLYADVRKGLAKILRPGGIAISCGWSGCGFGDGFELREMMVVTHGGAHNATIVTVEERLSNLFDQGAA